MHDAIIELYQDHGNALLRMASALVGRQDAEDLLSQSFYNTLRSVRNGVDPPKNLIAYFITTMRNTEKDIRKRQSRRPTEAPTGTLSDRSTFAYSAPKTGENEQETIEDYLRTQCRGLSDQELSVVALILGEGYGQAEVAQLLGITTSAVKQTYYRAKGKLRQSFLSIESTGQRTLSPIQEDSQ